MNQKLKKILNVVLTIAVFTLLLCGCKNGNTGATDNNSGKNENNKEEYVARITAYKEYYEGIENDYYSVNGAILVHEDGMPYMVLSCTIEQDVDKYKILLIDYKDGKAVICGEKEFSGWVSEDGGNVNCDVDLAFIDDRCIMRVQYKAGERGTEYWEFVEGNLLAQKLSDKDARKFEEEYEEEFSEICYVYDVSEKPYEYLYTSYNGKISIYDKESDIDTVNNIAAQRIQDYMQLSDEQKEYFTYDKKAFQHKGKLYELIVGVNICIYDTDNTVLLPLTSWGMEGVTFRQCLNELINEPLYQIEYLKIKELDFMLNSDKDGDMCQLAAKRKEEKLKEIYEKMPKYNPYDTDEQLLREYYYGIREICVGKGVSINAGGYTIDENTLPYVATDLATLMGRYEVAQALDVMFEENPLEYDYIFTSDEFKGASWKDITFNGSHKYPVLTLSKNGNTISCSSFDNYVEFRENTELKRAIEAYAGVFEVNYNNYVNYAFVYIDEDDIPEMITNYMVQDENTNIYSYKNEQLIKLELNWDQWIGGYLPKQNSIVIFEEDYVYEDDGTSYRDGKYTQYSILDNEFKYVKDIDLTEEYESVSFDEDMMSALGKIYSLRNE